jgi:hypothetical protein
MRLQMSVDVLESDPLAQHDHLHAIEQLADLLRGAIGGFVLGGHPHLGGFLNDLLPLRVHAGIQRVDGCRAGRSGALPLGELGEQLIEGLHLDHRAYRRDRLAYSRGMVAAVPAPAPPATTIDDVIARMQAIDAALPASDGVACFNRMYLQVTLGVAQQVKAAAFADPHFVAQLDVVFANLYFVAVDSLGGPASGRPLAWQPLLEARGTAGIEPIQFALAGMNAHINHDLPIAVVSTCTGLDSAPTATGRHDDYQKIDALLDAAEQSVRESFEPKEVAEVDTHVAAVANLVGTWSITSARDVAWDTALVLWEMREHRTVTALLTGALAHSVGLASRLLLVAV